MFRDISYTIEAYARALRLIPRLGLWGYLFVPALVAFFLLLIIGGAAWGLSDNLGNFLLRLYPFEWGADYLAKATDWVGLVLIALLGFIIYKHMVIAFSAPWMSPLSEKVERHLLGKERLKSPFSIAEMLRDTMRGVRIAIRNIIWETLFTVILLLLSFIPLFTPFTSIAIILVQAYYAGFGNLDVALERHYNAGERIRWVRRRKVLTTANGLPFVLLLLTGLGFLIAPTLCTIAGTIAVVEEEA